MDSGADRISVLPEDILHHILSFLHTEDVVRTATSCKRLNRVWGTLPYLDLNLTSELFPPLPYDETDEDEEESQDNGSYTVTIVQPQDDDEEDEEELNEIMLKREKLFTFVDRTLSRWSMQDLTVQKFKLTVFKLDRDLRQHLDQWLHYLLNSNIKELVLNVTGYVPGIRWYPLPPILFSATSLHALTLANCRMVPSSGSISLLSLRKMHLMQVYIEEDILIDIINTNRDLEDLKLYHCPRFQKGIHVSAQSSLKSLALSCDELFDEVLIDSPYLEKFTFLGGNCPSNVSLLDGKSLKQLVLCCANITHTQLSDLVSSLPCLEALVLASLNLKTIEISSATLKQLKLERPFDGVKERRFGDITIGAPNLVFIRYMGCLSSAFRKSMAVREVIFHMDGMSVQTRCPAEECIKLVQFLQAFDHSDIVTINCSLFELMIYPVDTRLNLLAPLAHIKHLKLQGVLQAYPDVNVLTEIVENLLWFSPNVDKLTLEDNRLDDGYPIEFAMEV